MFLFCTQTASADNVLKPYVVLMLDTSGSMDNSTSAGPPTCGGLDNRLNHARCAINKIVNSYGDMVFALGRFRMSAGGTFSTSCDANGDVAGGGADQCTASGNACTATDNAGEMLTGLVDGGNSAASTWTDFGCATCGGAVGTPLSANPEIWAAGGSTPLGGYLQSAWDYWKGQEIATSGSNALIYSQKRCVGGTAAGAQCTVNANCAGGGTCTGINVGFDPIRNDPLNAQFLPTGCDPNPATCGANCCDTQCRPYITIMLTDGDETCGGNAEPVAASMLNTLVDNREYKIETKVIGFGVNPGDTDIERYAHAGGAIDVPGKFEGYYVNDEASLQLALAQILADAVKVETCNNKDDDCDGNVDEDFLPPKSIPGKGGTCDNGQLGACYRAGALQCRADGAGLECNAVTVQPGSEGTVCNGIDDNCDGRIDEGLTCNQCVPTAETCDGNDNDCDGVADQVCRCSNNNSLKCDADNDCGAGACDCQPITRPCGNNACGGTEMCTAGVFSGCDARVPTTEVCDGIDNDCDGLCDGFTLECSNYLVPAPGSGPGTDSPGSPGHNPQPIAANICRPGLKTCNVDCDGSNAFTACAGEILPCNGQVPCTDPCNGLDDDCDNEIDEDFAEADCSTNCGTGKTKCDFGSIVCNSVAQGQDNNCNNVDEDCDGKTDEGWTCPGGICDCSMDNGVPVCDGELKCVTGGVVICDGGPVNPEICNCMDDDCDGTIDNGTPGQLCPGGGTCVNCQCADMCTADEFPCPLGKKCEVTANGNFCVNDPCFNVTCTSGTGNKQTCIADPNDPQSHVCVDTCVLVGDSNLTEFPPCPTGLVCVDASGECRPDTCETFPDRCASNERCIGGTCVVNPCIGVTCETGQYCVGGNCVSSCSEVDCPDGQRCRQGACEENPCGQACPAGQECNDTTGQCIEDPCKFRECAGGEWCNPNNGQCELDPCQLSDITCPDPAEVCKGGTCGAPVQAGPDGGATFVTVGGGGCSTGGGDTGLALVLALGLLVSRRRRTAGGAL